MGGAPVYLCRACSQGLCPTGRGRALWSGLVTAVARQLPVAGCEVRGGLKPQHLPLHQPGVEAALGQLLVSALLLPPALVEHHDESAPAPPVLSRCAGNQPCVSAGCRGWPAGSADTGGHRSHGHYCRPPPTQSWLRSRVRHIPQDTQPLWGFFTHGEGLPRTYFLSFVLGGQSSEPDMGQHLVSDGRAPS